MSNMDNSEEKEDNESESEACSSLESASCELVSTKLADGECTVIAENLQPKHNTFELEKVNHVESPQKQAAVVFGETTVVQYHDVRQLGNRSTKKQESKNYKEIRRQGSTESLEPDGIFPRDISKKKTRHKLQPDLFNMTRLDMMHQKLLEEGKVSPVKDFKDEDFMFTTDKPSTSAKVKAVESQQTGSGRAEMHLPDLSFEKSNIPALHKFLLPMGSTNIIDSSSTNIFDNISTESSSTTASVKHEQQSYPQSDIHAFQSKEMESFKDAINYAPSADDHRIAELPEKPIANTKVNNSSNNKVNLSVENFIDKDLDRFLECKQPDSNTNKNTKLPVEKEKFMSVKTTSESVRPSAKSMIINKFPEEASGKKTRESRSKQTNADIVTARIKKKRSPSMKREEMVKNLEEASNNIVMNLTAPTVEMIKEISKFAKLKLTDAEAREYADCIADCLPMYEELDRIAIPKNLYNCPRDRGYEPLKEDNPFNAWWFKTNIKGGNKGALNGKRIGIKDCVMLAGVPMINGSSIMGGYIPDEDATVVSRILAAGGWIIGKTTCENLCFSASSFTSSTGPVRNPYDKSRSAGGSSSGNAVLLQQGELDMAVGTDAGGSIRVPSSFCGTVGLKPTYGLVPCTGAASGEPTIEHMGPMAANVMDCAKLLEVIAGPDGLDFRQPRVIEHKEYSKLLNLSTGKKLRIGRLLEGFDHCTQEVVDVVMDLVKLLRFHKIKVEDISVPEHNQHNVDLLFDPIGTEGTFKYMMQNSGVMHGQRTHHNVPFSDCFRMKFRQFGNEMTPAQKLTYLKGCYFTERYGLHYSAKAHNLLPQLTKAYDSNLETCDVLLMPTTPNTAQPLPPNPRKLSVKEYLKECFQDTQNTKAFNLTGHPALSLNAGFTATSKLPVGVQIVGKRFDDATVLQAGYAIEQCLLMGKKQTVDVGVSTSLSTRTIGTESTGTIGTESTGTIGTVGTGSTGTVGTRSSGTIASTGAVGTASTGTVGTESSSGSNQVLSGTYYLIE